MQRYVGYYSGVSNVDAFAYLGSKVWNGAAYVTPDDADIASYRQAIARDDSNSMYAELPGSADRFESRIRGDSFAASPVIWGDPLTPTELLPGAPVVFVPPVPPAGKVTVYGTVVNDNAEPQKGISVIFRMVTPPNDPGIIWTPGDIRTTTDNDGIVSKMLTAAAVWKCIVNDREFTFTTPSDGVFELPAMVAL